MANRILMPQLGESVTEGTIAKWLKKPGDAIKKDEPLAEISTDKVDAELPSPYAGIVGQLTAAEGTTVQVGQELAIILAPGEALPGGASPAQLTAAAPIVPAAAPVTRNPEPETRNSKKRASPVVERLAQEHGLNIDEIPGTGLGGRVSREDVLSFIEQGKPAAAAPMAATPQPVQAAVPEPVPAPPAPAPQPVFADLEQFQTSDFTLQTSDEGDYLVELTAWQRDLALEADRSEHGAPHTYSTQMIDVTDALAHIAREGRAFESANGAPLTLLAVILKAIVQGLRKYPYMNANWTDEGVLYQRDIHLGVTMPTPSGVRTPVIRNADQKDLSAITRELADLRRRAAAGRLTRGDCQGGTYVVHDAAPFDAYISMPIIGLNQAGVLALGMPTKRVVARGEGLAIRTIMTITSAFDHRITDGLQASALATFVRQTLEARAVEA